MFRGRIIFERTGLRPERKKKKSPTPSRTVRQLLNLGGVLHCPRLGHLSGFRPHQFQIDSASHTVVRRARHNLRACDIHQKGGGVDRTSATLRLADSCKHRGTAQRPPFRLCALKAARVLNTRLGTRPHSRVGPPG